MNFIIIETTFSKISKAKKLAKILLEKKLTACVQFIPINSMYIWQEKIQNAKEILVAIKTKEEFFPEIAAIIKSNHEYELPEVISKKITAAEEYSKWLMVNLK
jgi:periplasmic divalent cation tolerance protein